MKIVLRTLASLLILVYITYATATDAQTTWAGVMLVGGFCVALIFTDWRILR